jgi:hypothetical protein
VFCAAGVNPSTVATSPDGVTWTVVTTPISLSWSVLTWSGTSFCLLASGSASYITSYGNI